MRITLYHRTYPVKDAPVTVSLVPFVGHQRHTYTVGDKEYEAECKELQIIVPADATIDVFKNLLNWTGDKGLVKSTAKEVFDMACAGTSGFRMAK
jgi:hypothetical protein